MHRDFIERYAWRGRRLSVMGLPVHEMAAEDLHAVIGFLLEQASDDAELLLAQEAPLGLPFADPPSNDGLLEG